jgi:hypothetical protein
VRWRPSAVTPAHRGRGAAKPPVSGADPAKPSPPRHVAMSWARRLKRVFGVQIESCARCGGELKIIASIEEPQLIAKMIEQVSLSKRRRACSRAQEHPLAWRHEFSRHINQPSVAQRECEYLTAGRPSCERSRGRRVMGVDRIPWWFVCGLVDDEIGAFFAVDRHRRLQQRSAWGYLPEGRMGLRIRVKTLIPANRLYFAGRDFNFRVTTLIPTHKLTAE